MAILTKREGLKFESDRTGQDQMWTAVSSLRHPGQLQSEGLQVIPPPTCGVFSLVLDVIPWSRVRTTTRTELCPEDVSLLPLSLTWTAR